MPTLECLDERSKNILESLARIENQFRESQRQLMAVIEKRDEQLDSDIFNLRKDVDDLRIRFTADESQRRGAVWVGGLALTAFAAIVGAIGNTIWAWAIGPHGPLGK